VNRCRRGLFSRVLNVYILFRRSTLNRHVPTNQLTCQQPDPLTTGPPMLFMCNYAQAF